jgi:hypothetical protein
LSSETANIKEILLTATARHLVVIIVMIYVIVIFKCHMLKKAFKTSYFQ